MPKIVLDPGHVKGHNKGAAAGYYEGTAMYAYAGRLAEKLRAAGVEVEITRKNVTDNPTLMERGKMAKGADLFVSLHSNAASSASAHGVTVFYSIKRSSDKTYAAKVCRDLAELIRGGTRNRGACTRKGGGDWDYYTVIQYAVKVNCPHVLLIEHGFHSHKEECAWLTKEKNLEAMADLECKLFLEILGIKASCGHPETKEPEKPMSVKVVNTPGDTLNVRKSADHTAAKLGELEHGAAVDVYGLADNGWVLVQLGDLRGWANGAYLVTPTAAYKVRVTAGSLNIRKGPGTSYATNGVVHGNEVLTIVDESKNGETRWGQLDDGRGWVSLKYTERA